MGEDADYQRAILETISGLSRDLEKTQEKIREDTTLLLTEYRKDSHRSIMAAQLRIAEVEELIMTFRQRYEEDKLTRVKEREREQTERSLERERELRERGDRQKDLDSKLGGLRTWQHVRLAVEVIFLLAILVFVIIRALAPALT